MLNLAPRVHVQSLYESSLCRKNYLPETCVNLGHLAHSGQSGQFSKWNHKHTAGTYLNTWTHPRCRSQMESRRWARLGLLLLLECQAGFGRRNSGWFKGFRWVKRCFGGWRSVWRRCLCTALIALFFYGLGSAGSATVTCSAFRNVF